MKKFNIFVCACVLLMGIQSAFSAANMFAIDETSIPTNVQEGYIKVFAVGQHGNPLIEVMETFSGVVNRERWSSFQKACNYRKMCEIVIYSSVHPKMIASFMININSGMTTVVTNYSSTLHFQPLSLFGIDLSLKR